MGPENLVRVAQERKSVFIKYADTPESMKWLRDERKFYEAVGDTFTARKMAFGESPSHVFLALEDLSGAFWPPPDGTGYGLKYSGSFFGFHLMLQPRLGFCSATGLPAIAASSAATRSFPVTGTLFPGRLSSICPR